MEAHLILHHSPEDADGCNPRPGSDSPGRAMSSNEDRRWGPKPRTLVFQALGAFFSTSDTCSGQDVGNVRT